MLRNRLFHPMFALAATLAACSPPTTPTEQDPTRPSLSVEVDYIPITRCGTVITQPGRYRLMADLVDCRREAGKPLAIEARDVELDLNRHRIAMTDYDGEDVYNLLISGSTNVVVRGPGTIEGNYNFGIMITSSSRVTITRVTSRDNIESNLWAQDVSELTVHDNTLLRGGYASLGVRGSSSRIIYNRITSRPYGENTILVEGGSTGLEFRGNVVEGGAGIVVRASGNTFIGNTSTGITFAPGVSGNRVVENVLGYMEDENGCGPNFFKGNWFDTAYPSCLQVPRVGR